MTTNLKPLRILVIVILALLAIQYEFGMAVNIANPPSIPPFTDPCINILTMIRSGS